MSGLFQELEGETCILLNAGVFTECTVYTRSEGELFAKSSSGFIRLYASGATSKSKYRIDTLTISTLYVNTFGHLFHRGSPGLKSLPGQPNYLTHEGGT